MERTQKPFPKKIVILIAIATLAMAVFLVYFFGLRTQDGDYDAATKQLSVMDEKARAFKKLGDDNVFESGSVTDAQITQARKLIQEYTAALSSLEASSVVRHDSKIGTRFESHKSLFENYSKTSSEMIDTVEAVAAIKQSCNVLLQGIASVTTTTAYDKAAKGCEDALENHESVAQPDFNENYFQAYRTQLIALLGHLRSYYLAGESGLVSSQQKAQAQITATLAAIQSLNQKDTYTVSTSTNPTVKIKELTALVSEQKATVFR